MYVGVSRHHRGIDEDSGQVQAVQALRAVHMTLVALLKMLLLLVVVSL